MLCFVVYLTLFTYLSKSSASGEIIFVYSDCQRNVLQQRSLYSIAKNVALKSPIGLHSSSALIWETNSICDLALQHELYQGWKIKAFPLLISDFSLNQKFWTRSYYRFYMPEFSFSALRNGAMYNHSFSRNDSILMLPCTSNGFEAPIHLNDYPFQSSAVIVSSGRCVDHVASTFSVLTTRKTLITFVNDSYLSDSSICQGANRIFLSIQVCNTSRFSDIKPKLCPVYQLCFCIQNGTVTMVPVDLRNPISFVPSIISLYVPNTRDNTQSQKQKVAVVQEGTTINPHTRSSSSKVAYFPNRPRHKHRPKALPKEFFPVLLSVSVVFVFLFIALTCYCCLRNPSTNSSTFFSQAPRYHRMPSVIVTEPASINTLSSAAGPRTRLQSAPAAVDASAAAST